MVDLNEILESEDIWEPSRFRQSYQQLGPLDRQALLAEMIGQKLPAEGLDPDNPPLVQKYVPAEIVEAAADVDPYSTIAAVGQYGFLISECMHCHKQKIDGRWIQVPGYQGGYSPASHGLCEPCMEQYYPEEDN